MRRKLPPLKALYAFEAAGRLLSFTRAAEELGVTQGAVSKQVGILEDHLGLRLFQRTAKQVTLTPEAALFLGGVTEAFDLIAGAAHGFAGERHAGETLTVSILPSLSSRWLIPMLGDFRVRHSRYHVRLVIGDGPVDFPGSGADIAVRAGRANSWKPLHAEPILSEELLPVASPDVLRRHPVKHPRDFLTLPLLEHTTRKNMWQEYLKAVGVKEAEVTHALGFEHFFMLIEAAADGLGAALIPRFLIERELEEGSLKVAYAKPFDSPYRYYLICPKRLLETRKVRAFRSWLAEKNTS